MAEQTYTLGDSEEEKRRLIRQAQRLSLSLRRLFEDAGIGPGMRVLDLGSGAGDVALLAAELVGETGSVVGLDVSPVLLDTARERARGAGHTNVTFVVSNLNQEVNIAGDFDAVVGRLVLLHLADPTATLRSVLRYLRPGGLAVFQEPALAMPSARAFPSSPAFERLIHWRNEGHKLGGSDPDMGWKLFQTLQDAGLAEPQVRAMAEVDSAYAPAGLRAIVATVRSMRPALIEHEVASEGDLDLDAIAEEVLADFTENRKIGVRALMFEAWARKP